MGGAVIRFYAELNDFLAPALRYREQAVTPAAASTAGSLIASCGVPLGEVDLVLRNGDPVPFTAPVLPGDRLAVYPVFESFDVTPVQRLRSGPLRTPRFVLDVHLGKLASFLRMLGFDALYRGDYTDLELIQISLEQRRALLSRDRALLAAPVLVRAYRVESEVPHEQVREVLRRFDLCGCARPFTRCLKCNSLLDAISPEEAAPRAPEKVRGLYQEFWRCPGCGRTYWRGSHYEKMSQVARALLDSARQKPGDD
jgi:hypothetical protein